MIHPNTLHLFNDLMPEDVREVMNTRHNERHSPMTKVALCRVSDTEPLRSIIPMLESAGYTCVIPNRQLRDRIREVGRNVDEFEDMHRRWGAEMPPDDLKEVGIDALNKCNLYIDVNGLNGERLVKYHPHLKGRILCYFINGGEPRNVPDKGDCQTPAWPMMTTAQHYRSTLFCPNKHWNVEAFSCDDPPLSRGYWTNHDLSRPGLINGAWQCPHGCGPLIKAPWLGKVYTFYPRFTRRHELFKRIDGTDSPYTAPVSLVHNCMSWGCQAYVGPARELGVKAYGGGNSPDGLVKHENALLLYSTALCTVYLKGGGAVDYSILEPMAAGCPTTFHSSYVHNCRLYDLLEDGVTCLMWNDEREMADCIKRLRDPEFNRKIGEAGRQRALEVEWSPAATSCTTGFKKFLDDNFPGA